MMRLFFAVSLMALSFAGGAYVGRDALPIVMPEPAIPVGPMPSPMVPDQPKGPQPLAVSLIELIGPDGKVSLRIFSDKTGTPWAIVNDHGTARQIDLSRMARYSR